MRPFSARLDYERVVDYFLTAEDSLLRGMGVERGNLPDREAWLLRLLPDLELADREKQAFFVAWIYKGDAVGHSNMNPIKFGDEANMHLHMWRSDLRHAGLGTIFLRKSVQVFFERFGLKKLICEPWAENPAPNQALLKVGFKFVRKSRNVPGLMQSELEANRYELTPGMLADV